MELVLYFITEFCWEGTSRWQVLLSCWASAVPYKALPGNANECAEVSEPLPTPAPHPTLQGTHRTEGDGAHLGTAAAVHGSTVFMGGSRHGKGIWGPGELVYPWHHTPVHSGQHPGSTGGTH